MAAAIPAEPPDGHGGSTLSLGTTSGRLSQRYSVAPTADSMGLSVDGPRATTVAPRSLPCCVRPIVQFCFYDMILVTDNFVMFTRKAILLLVAVYAAFVVVDGAQVIAQDATSPGAIAYATTSFGACIFTIPYVIARVTKQASSKMLTIWLASFYVYFTAMVVSNTDFPHAITANAAMVTAALFDLPYQRVWRFALVPAMLIVAYNDAAEAPCGTPLAKPTVTLEGATMSFPHRLTQRIGGIFVMVGISFFASVGMAALKNEMRHARRGARLARLVSRKLGRYDTVAARALIVAARRPRADAPQDDDEPVTPTTGNAYRHRSPAGGHDDIDMSNRSGRPPRPGRRSVSQEGEAPPDGAAVSFNTNAADSRMTNTSTNSNTVVSATEPMMDVATAREVDVAGVDGALVDALETIVANLEMYRPHLPHWVLDAALKPAVAGTATPPRAIPVIHSPDGLAGTVNSVGSGSEVVQAFGGSSPAPPPELGNTTKPAAMRRTDSMRSATSTGGGNRFGVGRRRSSAMSGSPRTKSPAPGRVSSPSPVALTMRCPSPTSETRVALARLFFRIATPEEGLEESGVTSVTDRFVDAVMSAAAATSCAVHSFIGDEVIASWSVASSVMHPESKAARFLALMRKYVDDMGLLDPAGASLPFTVDTPSAAVTPIVVSAAAAGGRARVQLAGRGLSKALTASAPWLRSLAQIAALAKRAETFLVDPTCAMNAVDARLRGVAVVRIPSVPSAATANAEGPAAGGSGSRMPRGAAKPSPFAPPRDAQRSTPVTLGFDVTPRSPPKMPTLPTTVTQDGRLSPVAAPGLSVSPCESGGDYTRDREPGIPVFEVVEPSGECDASVWYARSANGPPASDDDMYTDALRCSVSGDYSGALDILAKRRRLTTNGSVLAAALVACVTHCHGAGYDGDGGSAFATLYNEFVGITHPTAPATNATPTPTASAAPPLPGLGLTAGSTNGTTVRKPSAVSFDIQD